VRRLKTQGQGLDKEGGALEHDLATLVTYFESDNRL
jgi:hypothetical protein